MPRCVFRLRSHIESAGHTCELRDVADFHSPSDVAHLVSQNPPFEGALAIHLFKAGRLLLGKTLMLLHRLSSFKLILLSVILSKKKHGIICLLSKASSFFLSLLDIHLPFGVIFGGTDINEDVKDEQKRVVMEQVLLKAR